MAKTQRGAKFAQFQLTYKLKRGRNMQQKELVNINYGDWLMKQEHKAMNKQHVVHIFGANKHVVHVHLDLEL